ncbi:hypothetical protein [Mesopusillimonas faecipullorum]|nr:hypothetical protein [Mesopusillimonas faecipullorum]
MSQTSVASRNKPRFSAGLVTAIIALFWIGFFVYFVVKGAEGLH